MIVLPNNVPAPNETNSPASNPPHSNESADSTANASSQTSDQKQSAFLRFLKTLEPYFKFNGVGTNGSMVQWFKWFNGSEQEVSDTRSS